MTARALYRRILVRLSKAFSRRNLYRWIDRAVAEQVPGGGRVLSVGAGGEISARLRASGLRFEEVDIDPRARPDHLLDLQDLRGIADGSVDALLCFEVLEHVRDPFRAVAEIRRVLRPGGAVLGSTPFLLPIHDAPRDYYRFTRHGLRALFEGFEQVELRERTGYVASAYGVLLRLYNVGTQRQKLVAVLLAPALLSLLPAALCGDLLVTNTEATTGYVFAFLKPARPS